MQGEGQRIQVIVIVGGGPVGNFCAALCGLLGIRAYVYEKRNEYTRQINIKIQKGFFQEIGKFVERLSWTQDIFFKNLQNISSSKGYKIQLKKLEGLLRQKAESLGIKYILNQQVKSFEQIQRIHIDEHPLILDCCGRHSSLRKNYFGDDQSNMKIKNLMEAMHINFDAQVASSNMFDLIYPVLKNSQNLKLGQLIVSKPKNPSQDKMVHVTVPLFITERLGELFDRLFPDINRNPIKPFIKEGINTQMPAQIQKSIFSIFCPLVMEGWTIKWDSVQVKKISITCGYAVERSHRWYVCLGDSAAHLAYFRSLNFGLETAYIFFKKLVSYPYLLFSRRGKFDQNKILSDCYKSNLHLWPTSAKEGVSMDKCIIKTHVLAYNIFTFNNINRKTSPISLIPYVKQSSADKSIQEYLNKTKKISWLNYLQEFEKQRQSKIIKQIASNTQKNLQVEIASYIVWANKLSPIKLSESLSYIKKGYFLKDTDFEYFFKTLKCLKKSLNNESTLRENILQHINIIEHMYLDSYLQKQISIWNSIMEIKELMKQKCFPWQSLTEVVMKFKYCHDYGYTNKSSILFLHCMSIIVEIKPTNQINFNKKFQLKEINSHEEIPNSLSRNGPQTRQHKVKSFYSLE